MIILREESNTENSYLLLSILWMKDGNPSKGNQQSKQTEKENNSNMASKLLQVQKNTAQRTNFSPLLLSRCLASQTTLVLDYSLI